MKIWKKIVHIWIIDKFIPPYIEFIKRNFDFNNHIFIVLWRTDKYPVKDYKNIININSIFQVLKFFKIIILLNNSNKIILHWLFSNLLNLILIANFWLLKKSYWVIWWGDLYIYKENRNTIISKIKEYIRKIIIKKLWNFVTYIKWDYNLTKKWYWSIWKYNECFMYESNIYKDINIKLEDKDYLNILVWNSSDKSNKHIEIFDKLRKYKIKKIKIIVPLTYWDNIYRKKIIKLWKKYFWNNFIWLVNFMTNDNYIKMLSTIDIAIFNHTRQQAMWNTISLLGMWKKVYLRNDTVQWELFKNLEIKVFDTIEDLDNVFGVFWKKQSLKNIKITKGYFSENNLINQWKTIFNN